MISEDKKRAIETARRSHERHCEQHELDELWRLAGQLGLKEETVERVWNETRV